MAGSPGSRIISQVYLQDNIFINNTGVPLYVAHTNLTIKGAMMFEGNEVKSGGGLCCENSNIIFYDKSKVSYVVRAQQAFSNIFMAVVNTCSDNKGF